MKSLFTLICAVIITTLVNRTSGADGWDITEPDRIFLGQIVNAVKNNNATWIADHMDYPLSVVSSEKIQIVATKDEFKDILNRKLTSAIRAKIIDATQKPLFKNWQGVMAGDGILWFQQYGYSEHGPWEYRIDAIGFFAFQPTNNVAR